MNEHERKIRDLLVEANGLLTWEWKWEYETNPYSERERYLNSSASKISAILEDMALYFNLEREEVA